MTGAGWLTSTDPTPMLEFLRGKVSRGRFEAALDGNPDTFWSAPAGSHQAQIEVDFEQPVTFDHALTMEWLNDGQHIQKYAVEIWSEPDNGWKRIAEGQAIGHKKIDQFPLVTARRIRLNILSSTSEAHIREFQLFDWSQRNSH